MILIAGRSSVPLKTAVDVFESISSRRHCAPKAKPTSPAGSANSSREAEKSTVVSVDSAGRSVDRRSAWRTASLLPSWLAKS